VARLWIIPLATYSAIATALAWPLPRTLSSALFAVPTSLSDVFIIVWATTWGAHALATHPTQLLEGNTFYPSGHAILGSEHALGTLPTFAPVWAVTGNPILAFNLHLLASVALSGLAMHVLVRRWTDREGAAYVAGIAFTAAPWRLNMWAVGPHILVTPYLPLVALFLDEVLRAPTRRSVVLGAGALAMQVACSYYLGYVAFALAAGLVSADLVVFGVRGRVRPLVGAMSVLVAAIVLVAPVTLPYLWWPRQEAFGMPLQETEPFRAFARSVGAPWPLAWGWAGFGTLLLAGCLPFWSAERWPDRTWRARTLGLVFAGVAALVLAPGPGGFFGGRLVIHDTIAAWLPGFGGIRFTYRFGVLLSFAASGLAGLAVAEGIRRGTHDRRLRLIAALVIAIAAMLQAPTWLGRRPNLVPIPTGDTIPEVYRWLVKNGGGAPVLELPVRYTEGTVEGFATYFSIYHWAPILNGSTGYGPLLSWLLKRYWTQMPSPDALRLLVGCTGVKWLIAHPDPRTRDAAWGTLPGLRLREIFPDGGGGMDRLFEVVDPTPSACANRRARDDVTLDGNPIRHLDRIEGSLRVDLLPEIMVATVEVPVTIVLVNHGAVPWPATAKAARDRLAVHVVWEPVSGDGARHDELWVAVPGDVGVGAEKSFATWLRPPRWPGRYRVVATAAQGDFVPVDPALQTPLRWEQTVTVLASSTPPPHPQRAPRTTAPRVSSTVSDRVWYRRRSWPSRPVS